MRSSNQYSIVVEENGGYEQDFSNMRRDDHASVCHRDVNLVLQRFEECKEKEKSFYYFIHHGDDGMYYLS